MLASHGGATSSNDASGGILPPDIDNTSGHLSGFPDVIDHAAETEHFKEEITMTEFPVEGPPEEFALDDSIRMQSSFA